MSGGVAGGVLRSAANGVENGAGYAGNFVFNIFQTEPVVAIAERVDSVMRTNAELLLGCCVVLSVLMSPLSFLVATMAGYWGYDKQICNLTGELLYRPGNILDHRLRAVICLVVALFIHLIVANGFYICVGILLGFVIKRMMIQASVPAQPGPPPPAPPPAPNALLAPVRTGSEDALSTSSAIASTNPPTVVVGIPVPSQNSSPQIDVPARTAETTVALATTLLHQLLTQSVANSNPVANASGSASSSALSQATATVTNVSGRPSAVATAQPTVAVRVGPVPVPAPTPIPARVAPPQPQHSLARQTPASGSTLPGSSASLSSSSASAGVSRVGPIPARTPTAAPTPTPHVTATPSKPISAKTALPAAGTR